MRFNAYPNEGFIAVKIRLVTTGRQDTFDLKCPIPVWVTWGNNAFKYSRCQEHGTGLMPVYVWQPQPAQWKDDGPGTKLTLSLGHQASEEMAGTNMRNVNWSAYPWQAGKPVGPSPAGDTATEILERQRQGDEMLGKMSAAMDESLKQQMDVTHQLIAANACEKLFEEICKDPGQTSKVLYLMVFAQDTPISNRWRNVALKAGIKEIERMRPLLLDASSFDKGHAEGYELGVKDGERTRNEHWSAVIAQMNKNHKRAFDRQVELAEGSYGLGRRDERAKGASDDAYDKGYSKGHADGYTGGKREAEVRCGCELNDVIIRLNSDFIVKERELKAENKLANDASYDKGFNYGRKQGITEGQMQVQLRRPSAGTYEKGYEDGVKNAELDIQDRMDRFAKSFRPQRVVVSVDPGSIEWSEVSDPHGFGWGNADDRYRAKNRVVDKTGLMEALYPNTKAQAPYTEADAAAHKVGLVKEASVHRAENGYTISTHNADRTEGYITLVFAAKDEVTKWLTNNLA